MTGGVSGAVDRFRVGVDGQVAVRAEVPGQQVPDAAGQRVRRESLQREG